MNNEKTSSRSSRRSAGIQSTLNLLLVIFLLVCANYIGFKYYAHKDLSASQFYALSGKTKDILHKLDAPLTISTLLIKSPAPFWDQTQNLLKEYQRVGGKNVTLNKIDPVYDRATAVTLQNRLHFSGSDNIIIFEYKNQSRVVKQDDLLDQDPATGQVGNYKGEQQFTGAIQALIEGKTSKVYFTAGHGEHPYDDDKTGAGYALVAQQLKAENITTATLNLAATGAVPRDADAVVIAGPSAGFSQSEAQAIANYLAGNGKLLLLLDPLAPSGLDDVLKKYSLGFDNDIVLARTMTNTGQAVLPLALIYQTGFGTHPITAKFPGANYYLAIADARSIHIIPDNSPEQKTTALLRTAGDAWGWAMKPNMTSAELATYGSRSFDSKNGDIIGPLTISAAYDGGTVTNPTTKAEDTATRVVLVGSAHFLENDTVADSDVAMNFFVNSVDWLVKKNAVLDISPKRPQEYGITLSPMSARTVAWTSVIFIPGIALALGLFVWFSRRK